MSSYEDRFVKIGVAFHALYFESEVGARDPPIFCIFDKGDSCCSICVVKGFRTNVLKGEFLL